MNVSPREAILWLYQLAALGALGCQYDGGGSAGGGSSYGVALGAGLSEDPAGFTCVRRWRGFVMSGALGSALALVEIDSLLAGEGVGVADEALAVGTADAVTVGSGAGEGALAFVVIDGEGIGGDGCAAFFDARCPS